MGTDVRDVHESTTVMSVMQTVKQESIGFLAQGTHGVLLFPWIVAKTQISGRTMNNTRIRE